MGIADERVMLRQGKGMGADMLLTLFCTLKLRSYDSIVNISVLLEYLLQTDGTAAIATVE